MLYGLHGMVVIELFGLGWCWIVPCESMGFCTGFETVELLYILKSLEQAWYFGVGTVVVNSGCEEFVGWSGFHGGLNWTIKFFDKFLVLFLVREEGIKFLLSVRAWYLYPYFIVPIVIVLRHIEFFKSDGDIFLFEKLLFFFEEKIEKFFCNFFGCSLVLLGGDSVISYLIIIISFAKSEIF